MEATQVREGSVRVGVLLCLCDNRVTYHFFCEHNSPLVSLHKPALSLKWKAQRRLFLLLFVSLWLSAIGQRQPQCMTRDTYKATGDPARLDGRWGQPGSWHCHGGLALHGALFCLAGRQWPGRCDLYCDGWAVPHALSDRIWLPNCELMEFLAAVKTVK